MGAEAPAQGLDPAEESPVEVVESVNRVVLRGRVSKDAEQRELPSGSKVVSFRLVVPRASTAMTKGSRQRSDWFDCSAWSSGTRKRVAGWRAGDTVEVVGALRRRYSRAAGGLSSVEIEVLEAVRLVRAGTPPVRRSRGAA